MSAQVQFFPLRGGLDQETPAIVLPPGKAAAVLNHEAVPLGYQRTEGFERYDGHPSPSDSDFYTLTFSEGETEFVVGTTITGAASGATFRVLAEATLDSGTFAGGDAAGTLAVHLVDGDFQTSELLEIGATTYARLDTIPEIGDWREGDEELEWFTAALDYARDQITEVPGSGAVRGVLWYGDRLNAWRDNEAGTAGVLHKSTASGWEECDLGLVVTFDEGGPYEIQPGDELVGDESGATATVRYVALNSGDWADSDATGVLVLDNVTGNLADETFSISNQLAVAHVDTAPSAMTFPAGGRYEFDIFNFYATQGSERAYGANGVGKAFEFDADTDSCVSITTGMTEDKPFLVEAHKNHLFLAFPYGSLQHSRVGEPRMYDGRLGAAELGMGHEITNLLPNTSAMLLVTTEDTLAVLTGNDSSDWVLEPLSEEAGARPYSAQRIGEVVYLDNRGLRSVASTQTYGNFKIGTYTDLINKALATKRAAGVSPVASCVVKTKSQYLLFFDDGSGVSIFFGTKKPEAMLFQYPFVVSCIHVVEVDTVERIFVGATNGFCYELNKGTSFDGDVIEAYLQLPFAHQGAPRLYKRYHKLDLEVTGDPGTEIGLITQFDYGGDEQPFSQEDALELSGGGGIWGLATWGEFIWSAPMVGNAEFYLDGAGFNMSPIIVSRQATVESYTIAGVTVGYSGRGAKR